jgi:hypothetical protein
VRTWGLIVITASLKADGPQASVGKVPAVPYSSIMGMAFFFGSSG